jgi:AcrR family transcriptional regulator
LAIRIPATVMTKRKKPLVSARKQPRQERSTRLVADILEAAARVLAKEGAPRFTTARVAEAAGVSVGSLYQYFPSKESILFRLQADEWNQTGQLIERILSDSSVPPFDRLRAFVRMFFRSECDEMKLRVALADAAPLYREAPEAREHNEEGNRRVLAFMKQALPHASARQRAFAADVTKIVISSTGKAISSQSRPMSEVDALADAISEMLCAYLSSSFAHERS